MNRSSLIGHLLELLGEVDQRKGPADRTTGEFFRARKYLGSHDRRFIADALYAIIRHRRRAEALLERYVATHPADAGLDAPRVRYLPLVAAAGVMLASGDGSPFDVPPSLWTTQFPRISLDAFLEAVRADRDLAFVHETDAVRLGVQYSFQDWMTGEWLARLGARAVETLLASLNEPAGVALRVNLLKGTRDECRDRLGREGVDTEISTHVPAGLRARKRFAALSLQSFRDGWFELQDEGSQLVGLTAAPAPGMTVLDACAGAGGKTLHMADLMENRGKIIAADTEPRRLGELQERAFRAGVSIVETAPPGGYGELAADVVLVDAPCSGIGTVRRSPWLKWSIAEEEIPRHASRQLQLLMANSAYVKPGGRLIYSTCSLFREENEEVVDRFLASVPGFEPSGRPPEGAVTLWPHLHGTDGFFIASFRRS